MREKREGRLRGIVGWRDDGPQRHREERSSMAPGRTPAWQRVLGNTKAPPAWAADIDPVLAGGWAAWHQGSRDGLCNAREHARRWDP